MNNKNNFYLKIHVSILAGLLFTVLISGQIPEEFTIWKFESGAINSIPILKDSVIYIGSMDSSFYAINKNTGEEIWHFKSDFPISSQPSLIENNLLFQAACKLYSLNAQTGQMQWSYVAREEDPESGQPTMYDHSFPVVYNGLVYFGDDWGNINGVDLTSGDLKFRYTSTIEYVEEDDWYIRSTPVIKDDIIYFGDHGAHVYAISLVDTSEVWIKRIYSPVHDGSVVSEMVIKDSLLFFGGYNNSISPLRLSDGEPIWTFVDGETFLPSTPIFYKNNVIVGSTIGSSKIHCLNITDGSKVWDFQAKGIFFVKPNIIKDSILVMNSTNPFSGNIGVLYFLNLNSGQFINEIHLIRATESSPIEVDSSIVIGKDDGVYRINYLPYLEKNNYSYISFCDTLTTVYAFSNEKFTWWFSLVNKGVFCDTVTTLAQIEGDQSGENIQFIHLDGVHLKPGETRKFGIKGGANELLLGKYIITFQVKTPKDSDNILIERQIVLVIEESSKLEETNSDRIRVEAYPNPFNTNVCFRITGECGNPVLLTVYSADGKLLLSKEYYVKEKDGTLIWDLSAGGILSRNNTLYYYIIQTSDKFFTGKLLKASN